MSSSKLKKNRIFTVNHLIHQCRSLSIIMPTNPLMNHDNPLIEKKLPRDKSHLFACFLTNVRVMIAVIYKDAGSPR